MESTREDIYIKIKWILLGSLIGVITNTAMYVGAQEMPLVSGLDQRFATSTMDIAQQEQVIWLEQRIKTLEQNDMQIIYMLEKLLGV